MQSVAREPDGGRQALCGRTQSAHTGTGDPGRLAESGGLVGGRPSRRMVGVSAMPSSDAARPRWKRLS
jgi:hypothetical protein